MFPLSFFRLASAQLAKSGSTQASSSWTLVTLPSSAAAAVARYHRCCCPPPPLLPSPLAATAAASGHCCCRLLPPPSSTAASVNRCRCRPLPSSLPAAAATSGLCHCRSLPLVLLTAASSDRRCRRCWTLPLPPPAAPAAARHGRPGGPLATSVGGGGSRDQGNPGRACPNPCGAFPHRPRRRDGPHAGGVLGPGDSLLTGVASIKGGPGPRPGAGDNGWTQLGRKGASHAIALLRRG